MQWEVKRKITEAKREKRLEAILAAVLANRAVKEKRDIQEFLEPGEPQDLNAQQVGINTRKLKKALDRIEQAIAGKESIVIYGDYDADGICATAVLWETLHALGASALPFIPHREKEGYGLSIKGINAIIKNQAPDTRNQVPSLIITVDNGIVAHEAVDYANQKGIDVVICDHHEKAKRPPSAHAIIHTTKLAGAGVAWIFAKEILKKIKLEPSTLNPQPSTLDLAAIGTVADMLPLMGANRSIVKHGLKALRRTKRIGVKTLFAQAQLLPADIDTYHINFIIAPRLNAMGRLEHALDALRLLCTKDPNRAALLAEKIGSANRRRQQMTEEMLLTARSLSPVVDRGKAHDRILIIDHSEFHEGIIGLIAGKLAEEYHRPVVVFARGKKFSKASARSVAGFNMIQAIRKCEHLLLDAGGHPMAAGFTIETGNIGKFTKLMRKIANETLTDRLLEPKLTLDCEIALSDVTWDLSEALERLRPFGIGNPKPIFSISHCSLQNLKAVGSEKQHLSVLINHNGQPIQGIAFRLGFFRSKLNPGDEVDLACSLDQNVWNGKRRLQLTIKDIKVTN